MCAVRLFLGLPCPGCGLLHALWAAGHCHFLQAFHYFPIWPVFLLLVIKRRSQVVGSIFLAMVFAQWLGRIFLIDT